MIEIKIGPHLTMYRDEYIPNMIDAFMCDNERGSHQSNNMASEQLKRDWPTVLAMAELIERQRDVLLGELEDVIESRPEINVPGCGSIQEVISKIKKGKY